MAGPLASRYAQEDFAPVRDALLAAPIDRPERLDHVYFQRSEPCTMLIDEVEAIWAPIAESEDWSRLEEKLAAISEMREGFGFDASLWRAA